MSRGASRPGTPANPRFLRRETTVEPFRLELLRRPALIPPPQKVGVAARPRRHEAPVDLDDTVRHPAQEGPVVGREHETSPVARDLSLDPFDGGEIEMIRRLVEEEEIRLPDHGSGQQDSAFLPARQRLEGGSGPDAGFLEGTCNPPVAVPALGRGSILKARGHDVVRATGERSGKNLGEKGDLESGRPLEGPGVRFAVAGENREEGGFSRAVTPREADSVAGRDFELDVREQHLGTDIGTNPPGSQQAHGMQGYLHPSRWCGLPTDSRRPGQAVSIVVRSSPAGMPLRPGLHDTRSQGG